MIRKGKPVKSFLLSLIVAVVCVAMLLRVLKLVPAAQRFGSLVAVAIFIVVFALMLVLTRKR